MKLIRLFILGYCVIFNINANALEIDFNAQECSVTYNSPIKSSMVVTGQVQDFFTITVTGGYPDYDSVFNRPCVNSSFNGYVSTTPVNGYAFLAPPLLYVFLPGTSSVGTQKEVYPVQYAYVFTINSDNSFTLLRNEWLGNYQGAAHSGSTTYNPPEQAIVYKLSN